MLSKKKKIFVLVGMVALLVATGCLNIFLNRPEKVSGEGGAYANFFAGYRAERITTRNEIMLNLDAIITNAATSAEAKRDAENQKLELVKSMELELELEALIKALGFEDVVVTNTTEKINIIIKTPPMDENQAAQVLDIIVTQTDKKAKDVRILPVE